MTNAMVRLVRSAMLAGLVIPAMGIAAHGEDYKCTEEAGCTARITEDGEVQEVSFRKGDLVSTEAGWVVSTDDGWVKVKNKGQGGV